MECKTFELRDSATFIPVLAVRLAPGCEADRYLLARAGYGLTPEGQGEYVLLCRIDGGEGDCASDPFSWGGARTVHIAHQHIIEHWPALASGQVIDVEFLLGETAKPKESEALS